MSLHWVLLAYPRSSSVNGRTRSSPIPEVQERLTLWGSILFLLVSHISEVDQCVLYAASALQASKYFHHLGLLEKQAFLSSRSISVAAQLACKPQSPKWQHGSSVFGSLWICLWGKPTTGSCRQPSKKGSFVSWAVTLSSVDSCNHDWVRNCRVLRNHLPPLISCWRARGALAVSVHYLQVWSFRQAHPRQVGFVINQSTLVWGEQPLLHMWLVTHIKVIQLSIAGFLQFLKCWWMGGLLWSQLALNAEHKSWTVQCHLRGSCCGLG